MAHSIQGQGEEGMVSWQKMRGYWIHLAFQVSKDTGENVKTYLNKFITNNGGYSFTITQLYDELYQACITTVQCSDVKRKLEKKFKLKLEDAPTRELFPGAAREKKVFKNAHEFRQFCEKDLLRLNRPIIARKHKEAHDHFTKVISAFNTQSQKSFMASDLEVYEHDHSVLLEIGYVIVNFSPTRRPREDGLPKAEVTSRKHLIIKENLHYKNKDNVPDNRDGFKFGVSQILSLEDAVKRFREDVTGCDYIFGHLAKHDDAYLREIGVDLSVLGMEIFDTQVIQTYNESLKEREKYFMRGLSYLLKEYNVEYQDSYLHNGGCDAFYTMMVFLRQMRYSVEEVNAIVAS